ncbi:PTS sugar transporter subunit IIA [Lactiplantibacillus fabifermentans]|uniref:N-acetylglucosamine galactosamine PTS, EIIA n=1 Tax=Lactiplantibacillus fabifermentans DSM 21115 TaxID=1413187 RepID=A0A0R2NNI8_9LACO|nr:PTS sugar transporter subunit IIA [Lactiplantibacillus fabifermentans]KRO27295.1 N-acetylglucosamine galactosamine PTS, EIIA [Lactiplantibacillus fabifermentans DSM 21115]
MKIIVTGHGNFATGIQSTVKLLAGELQNVEFIDFTGDMNDVSLNGKLTTALADTDKAVFFCDLLGGTPFKEAVKISTTADQDIAVITGCNVGSLLEVGFQLADYAGTATELATTLVTTSKAQTKVFEHHAVIQDADEDGI